MEFLQTFNLAMGSIEHWRRLEGETRLEDSGHNPSHRRKALSDLPLSQAPQVYSQGQSGNYRYFFQVFDAGSLPGCKFGSLSFALYI